MIFYFIENVLFLVYFVIYSLEIFLIDCLVRAFYYILNVEYKFLNICDLKSWIKNLLE